jgi:hypothetical protein
MNKANVKYKYESGLPSCLWVREAINMLKMPCGRFEVLTAVTMKNAVFWDVTP